MGPLHLQSGSLRAFPALGFAAFLAFLTLGGCAHGPIKAPDDAYQDLAALWSHVSSYLEEAPESFYLETRASQYSDAQALKGKVDFLGKSPASLRMMGLSPTDDVLSVMVTDGKLLQAFQRGENYCYAGPACPHNIGIFASIPLRPEELRGALIGRPFSGDVEAESFEWDELEGAYKVRLKPNQLQREVFLWAKHGTGRIVRVMVRERGKTKADVRYSRFQDESGIKLPSRIDIQLDRETTDLRISVRSVELGPTLKDGAFSFSCPKGTEFVELECPN